MLAGLLSYCFTRASNTKWSPELTGWATHKLSKYRHHRISTIWQRASTNLYGFQNTNYIWISVNDHLWFYLNIICWLATTVEFTTQNQIICFLLFLITLKKKKFHQQWKSSMVVNSPFHSNLFPKICYKSNHLFHQISKDYFSRYLVCDFFIIASALKFSHLSCARATRVNPLHFLDVPVAKSNSSNFLPESLL